MHITLNLMRHQALSSMAIALAGFFILSGCTDNNRKIAEKGTTLTNVTEQQLDILNQHKFYFMHHSVGDDIINGIQLLAEEKAIPVNIIALDGNAPSLAIQENGFAHARGGKNQFPMSKIADFEKQISRLVPDNRPNIAFMKFCYVDFNPETNVDELFDRYTQTLDSLQKAYPDIRFIHVTAPLKQRPSGWKDRLNRLMGRMVWEDTSNRLREAYNQKIRNRYPSERIFDLAKFESTAPDGSRTRQEQDGMIYYSLVPEYSRDGGHLNDTGKRVLAAALIDFLSKQVVDETR